MDGSIVVTLGAGAAGGLLGNRLRMPGGSIFGALLASAAVHLLLSGLAPLSPQFRTAAQIMLGGVIGSTLVREPLVALRPLAGRVLAAVAVILAASLAGGAVFASKSSVPLETALFSAAPGSASDMAAAALHFDADVPFIAAFHAVRQVLVFVVVAALFSRFLRPGRD